MKIKTNFLRIDNAFKNAVTFVLVCIVIFLISSVSTYAATITVSSKNDISADDGECTLREAIEAANSNTASGANLGE